MADEMKIALAKQVYEMLCQALDDRGWSYDKEDERQLVHFGVGGDDLPMKIIASVDTERQLVRVMSPLPFNMSEGKRIEGAIATCAASYGMVDGSFDYDLSDGQILFRMTASFRESEIGPDLLLYLIDCSCAMVDKYNEQFFAIDKGFLSITDFLEKA